MFSKNICKPSEQATSKQRKKHLGFFFLSQL